MYIFYSFIDIYKVLCTASPPPGKFLHTYNCTPSLYSCTCSLGVITEGANNGLRSSTDSLLQLISYSKVRLLSFQDWLYPFLLLMECRHISAKVPLIAGISRYTQNKPFCTSNSRHKPQNLETQWVHRTLVHISSELWSQLRAKEMKLIPHTAIIPKLVKASRLSGVRATGALLICRTGAVPFRWQDCTWK